MLKKRENIHNFHRGQCIKNVENATKKKHNFIGVILSKILKKLEKIDNFYKRERMKNVEKMLKILNFYTGYPIKNVDKTPKTPQFS